MYNLLKEVKLFSKVTVHSTWTPSSVWFLRISLALVIINLFYYIHASRVCEMVSHCGFDFHFSDGWWCWASLHMLIETLSSLEKYLFRSFAHLLICNLSFYHWVVSSSYIDTRLLSDIWFANYFSHSVGFRFTFLMVSFAAQNFAIWWRPVDLFFLGLLVLLVSYLRNHWKTHSFTETR